MSGAPPVLPEGFHLHAFDAVGSTNDEAKSLAHAGAPDGTLVWAKEQKTGRGRRGRTWHSPPGNLYLSLVLRPETGAAQAAQLGFVAALGLADALSAVAGPDLALRCKWPNDLLANGKKIAGILLESETGGGDGVDFVVLGIGVNIAHHPSDTEYPATSLAERGLTGTTPARLLEGFAPHFAQWYGRWHEQGFAPVRKAWLARATGLGDAIRVRLERTTLLGRFLDLDEDGALLLDAAPDHGGGHRRITAGEVFPALA